MSQNNSVEILLEPVFLKKGVNGYDSTGVLRYKSNGLYFHGVRPDEKEAKKGCGSFWGYGWDIENHEPAPGSTLRKLHKKKWDFHIQEWEFPSKEFPTDCNNFCSNCSDGKVNRKSIQFTCLGHTEEEVCPSKVQKFITRPLKNGTSRKCLSSWKRRVSRWTDSGAYYCEKMNIYVQPYKVESNDVPEKEDGSQLTIAQILERRMHNYINNVENTSPLAQKKNDWDLLREKTASGCFDIPSENSTKPISSSDTNVSNSDTDSSVSSSDNNATDSDSDYIPSESDYSPKSTRRGNKKKYKLHVLPPNCSVKRKSFTDREKVSIMHRQQYKCAGNCDQLLDIECMDIDHIVENQDLGHFDNNHYNLVALCCNCHRKKTNKMIKIRRKLAKKQTRVMAKKGIEVLKAKWGEKNQISMEFPIPSYLNISDQL